MSTEGQISGSFEVKSKSSSVNVVCEKVLGQLEANSFSQPDIFAIHLALEEAFINAIKHGNKMDSNKKVKIDYAISPDSVEICLTDEGEGFDPEEVPDPRFGKNVYRTGGRGTLLMYSYMDVIEYNKRGNRVRMVRYREKPALF